MKRIANNESFYLLFDDQSFKLSIEISVKRVVINSVVSLRVDFEDSVGFCNVDLF